MEYLKYIRLLNLIYTVFKVILLVKQHRSMASAKR